VILVAASKAGAVTIRYALIIGNNIGVDTNGKQPFPPLMHAEREAEKLKDELVGLSNFDSSSMRTRLLKGATRSEVESAVRALSAQKSQDEKSLGNVDSLFLLYFTGHGLEERLLFRDGALSARDLGRLIESVHADFTVGIFDACYSGSLESAVLTGKGIDPTPGLNLFRELPEEVLSAEGAVWYVSSGPGQESYEDKELGGIFTHFFTEALKNAAPEGPGITLDSIWQYARGHTVEYTAERKRTQLPERFIAKMRSGAPIYFSFPVSRTATLVLTEAIEGRFALAYAASNLTELFDKTRGKRRNLAVYPGNGKLMRLENGKAVSKQDFSLTPGSTLVVSALKDSAPSPNVGEQADTLTGKGLSVTQKVSVTTIKPGLSLMLGAGYMFDMTAKELLYARHGFLLPFRVDLKHAVMEAAPSYGFDNRTFSSWGYQVQKAGFKLSGGYGFDLGPVRLTGAVAFTFAYLWQKYDSGEKRESMQFSPTAAVNVLYPRKGRLKGALFADIGSMRAQGAGDTAEYVWYLTGTVGLSLYCRLY
jgi:hypothetical protein